MNPLGPRPRGPLLILTLGGLALALTCFAALSASRTLGMRFPSCVVDAYGIYSIVELPRWASPTPPPQGLHRLASVNDKPLSAAPPPLALKKLYELLKDEPEGTQVRLVFEGPEGPLPTVTASVRALGLEEVLFLFVTYTLAAWVVLWSGALVFIACHRTASQRAYSLWSTSAFLFLLSFYDHHTKAWLFPAFSVSTIGILLGALWLAYAFPKPPRRGASALRGLLGAATLVGAAAVLWLLVGAGLGWNSLPIRRAIDWLMAPGLLTLALVFILRLRRSTGRAREELAIASWGLIATPLLIAIVHLGRMVTHRDAMHLVLPFIVLLFPLSVGYALIRHNLLESRLVLTRAVAAVPFVLGALLLAVLGAYLLWLAAPGPLLLIPLGLVLFALLMLFARRLQVRLFFPSALAFRGTVGHLKEQLASLREIPAIRGAVEEAVAKALPSQSAQVLDATDSTGLASLPPEAREQLARGENVWPVQGPHAEGLLIPMRSLGELRAVLCLIPQKGSALYTQEDLSLLETLASLGALALHNAAAVQELESLRRLEASAARDEKRLALGALSTEICHEVVYPLNFLRDLLRRSGGGQTLDEEDLSFARMEVARMNRMIDSLRLLDLPSPQLGALRLIEPIHRALLLLREPIQQKKLSVSVEVPSELRVNADMDSLLQLFSNLLRNAAQSAPEAGAIGVRYREGPEEPDIDIWDTGPGIPQEIASVLFIRRVSTKPEGYGIGLTVVQRIARSFQWRISFLREDNLTCFRLTLPSRHEHPRHE
jgi:two-component system sensor histidine kinase KdpD